MNPYGCAPVLWIVSAAGLSVGLTIRQSADRLVAELESHPAHRRGDPLGGAEAAAGRGGGRPVTGDCRHCGRRAGRPLLALGKKWGRPYFCSLQCAAKYAIAAIWAEQQVDRIFSRLPKEAPSDAPSRTDRPTARDPDHRDR